MTYDLIAIMRDVAALWLLLTDFALVVLAIAGRGMTSKGIVQAGCVLVMGLAGGLLSNARGIFPNRLVAVGLLLLSVGLWVIVNRVRSAVRG